jgi:hypothetical protein
VDVGHHRPGANPTAFGCVGKIAHHLKVFILGIAMTALYNNFSEFFIDEIKWKLQTTI